MGQRTEMNTVDTARWVEKLRTAVQNGSCIGEPVGGPMSSKDLEEYYPVGPRQLIPAEAIKHVLLDRTMIADPRGLRILGATISGVLNLDFAVLPFRLEIMHSAFENEPSFKQTVIPELVLFDTELPGLNVDGIRLIGDAKLNQMQANGPVSMMGARIGGQLILSGSVLCSLTSWALRLDNAEVGGDVFLRDLNVVQGEVRALRIIIGGQLNLTGETKLHNPASESEGADKAGTDGDAFSLDGAEIMGDIFLAGVDVVGQLRAPGIHVGGQVDLSKATLTNPNGTALSLDGAQIGSDLFMKEIHARGEVRALAARIGGQFVLRGAKICNSDGDALSLQGIDIKGHLLMDKKKNNTVVSNDGFEAWGKVSVARASIGSQIGFEGSLFHNATCEALNLDGIRVKGDMLFGRGMQAWGKISAVRAQVDGRFTLIEVALHNTGHVALDLSNMSMDIFEMKALVCEGQVDLSSTKIRTLIVPERDGQQAMVLPALSSAQGWEIGTLIGFLKTDCKAARAWLTTINPAGVEKEFSAQPWKELADVYTRIGQPSEGRWLRYQAAIRSTEAASVWVKPFRGIYRITVGYGYRPLLILVWMLFAILIATCMANATAASIVPTDSRIAALKLADSDGNLVPVTAAARNQPSTYPAFDPVLYALDTALPAADTGQSKAWRLIDDPVPAFWFAVIKTASWIFAALLLAGLAGILRKD